MTCPAPQPSDNPAVDYVPLRSKSSFLRDRGWRPVGSWPAHFWTRDGRSNYTFDAALREAGWYTR